MNTILLVLWIKITFITLMCIYYNLKIVDKFLESSTPKQYSAIPRCDYANIPTIDISKLENYPNNSGIDTYIYTVDNTKYIISPSERLYSTVCSGFCTEGITPTGTCKIPSNQKLYEQCETLLQPTGKCLSLAKPLVTVVNGTSKQSYYAFSPYTPNS